VLLTNLEKFKKANFVPCLGHQPPAVERESQVKAMDPYSLKNGIHYGKHKSPTPPQEMASGWQTALSKGRNEEIFSLARWGHAEVLAATLDLIFEQLKGYVLRWLVISGVCRVSCVFVGPV